MRVTIEVDSEQEFEYVTAFLREQGIPVLVGGGGASAPAPFDPEERRQELDRLFAEFQGSLPENYTFDREEAHER